MITRFNRIDILNILNFLRILDIFVVVETSRSTIVPWYIDTSSLWSRFGRFSDSICSYGDSSLFYFVAFTFGVGSWGVLEVNSVLEVVFDARVSFWSMF